MGINYHDLYIHGIPLSSRKRRGKHDKTPVPTALPDDLLTYSGYYKYYSNFLS